MSEGRPNLGLGVVAGAVLVIVGCLFPWSRQESDVMFRLQNDFWRQMALLAGLMLLILGVATLRQPQDRRIWLGAIALALVPFLAALEDAARSTYVSYQAYWEDSPTYFGENFDPTRVGVGIVVVLAGSVLTLVTAMVGLRRSGVVSPP